MLAVSNEASDKRLVFFEAIFGELSGYVRLARVKYVGDKKVFNEDFLRWPEQTDLILDYANRWTMTHSVYYSPTLYNEPKGTKQHVGNSLVAWADLDSCSPNKVAEKPTIVLESSPNRFQALWRFDQPVTGYEAEDISRRIAYKYEEEGCDKTGWDLSQLLRIPFTINHKYTGGALTGPQVKVIAISDASYTLAELQGLLPQVADYAKADIPMPDLADLPQSAEDVMQLHKLRLQPLAFHLFTEQPERDWSAALWQFEMFCIEAGMNREEVYVCARESACNKYKRDNISELQLWKEVCRAYLKFESNNSFLKPSRMEALLSDEDKRACLADRTLIDDYMDWAKTIGDAAPQYHQAGAFIILSSLLAGPVKLPTSFGVVLPNIWFMILADTTLTRKTTAMDLAIDLISEVDDQAMMATDGSIEGLFGALQFRPGRPSIFLRDEFSGLIEQMTKKDYYAGMAETLTKLYDGKFQKRILRRDVIEVRDPVLIIFAGGIRERILSLLQYEHIASGFLPRFVFITAESDLSRIRPLGPPTDSTLEGRSELVQRLTELHSFYTSAQSITVNDKVLAAPPEWKAQLTMPAWSLYNHYEASMMEAALKSREPDLITPMFDRLSKSGLKAAVLLACMRMEDKLVVEESDIMKAFSYVEYWRTCSIEVVENIGRSTSERVIQSVLRMIRKEDGCTRSEVMQRWHLDARSAESILMTLEQRGLLNRRKSGRTEWLYATVIPNQ